MRKAIVFGGVVLALAGVAGAGERDKMSPWDPQVEDLSERGEPPMLGPHWSREAHGAHQARPGGPKANPNMTYHGGKIMTDRVSKAIFWGPSWTNASFAGDKITGLDDWYTGHSGSNYAKTRRTSTPAATARSASADDRTRGTSSTRRRRAGGNNTSAILAEVCKQTSPRRIPTGNGYYPVYTDVKRGNAGYCAWHSVGHVRRHAGAVRVLLQPRRRRRAAIRRTPRAGTRRASPRSRTSPRTSSPRPAPTRPAPAPGTTPRAPRTATSAPGPSTRRS